MNERLLQFIWRSRYFNQGQLCTTGGDRLQVIHPGSYNTNQGPDFLNAKIKIGHTTWAGNIELHVRAGDWELHGHSSDSHYSNVILHVVWEDDGTARNDIPVLVLHDRVPKILLQHYHQLVNHHSPIPCGGAISTITNITWLSWKERLLVERLQQKAAVILASLESNAMHWEEVFWWMLARNFGTTVNSEAFEMTARSIPLNILAKHKMHIHQLEALLSGQAGLLNGDHRDEYPRLLQREYLFLKNKYRLRPVHLPVFFMRMRPAGFPSLRLAQLAMLVYQSLHLFSVIKEERSLKAVRSLLTVTASEYWNDHYVFDVPSVHKKKKLGAQVTDTVLINAVVPVLFAYGHYHNDTALKEKALQWLMETGAEKNHITRCFTALGVEQCTAFDSQALIQLKQAYCDKRKCLDCAVGNKLLMNYQAFNK